ncbi:hypothetical protein CKO28_09825 [Rhodovibrio sodomensis]|uniref:Uncharacterized protein n=1 Tax=Rhodovibrio sodomensis TaxID=1088 RepID=A0ABS1DEH4_9PROT|nr:hypothetical protein [Rhodovibrio sodomensis]MBK1668332.1 hypothetical protein [Rhodovibrio sodomensis]
MSNVVQVAFGKAAPRNPEPAPGLFAHPTMAPFAKSLTADQRTQVETLIRDAWVQGWTVETLQTQLARLLDRKRKHTALLARTGLAVAAHA